MADPPAFNFNAFNEDDDDGIVPEPHANPPPNHKLLTHKYDTLADLEEDLHEWCAKALFGIKKTRPSNMIKGFGYSRVDFACIRDKIRPSQAFTGWASSTRNTGCEWLATAKALKEDGRKWSLLIRCGDHNHAHAESRDDIATLRKFEAEHRAYVATFNDKLAVTNRQIAHGLRERFPRLIFTKKQLKNLRARLRKSALDGYTPFQYVMKTLDERGISYKWLPSAYDPNKPEGLVWTDDWCKEQWRLNPGVQLYDKTYKTNNKGLALFQGFDWLMDQINELRQEIGAPAPSFTITDYDHALRAAIARRKWNKQAAADVATAFAATQAGAAQSQDDAQDDPLDEDDHRVVVRLNRLASDDGELPPLPETVEYSRAGLYKLWGYEKLKAFFSQQTAIITYLEETYMTVVQDWATCYTNRRLNFGLRTTSPVESANRYLKTFLVFGNSNIAQVVEQTFNMVAEMKRTIDEEPQHQKNHSRREYMGKAWLGNTALMIANKGLQLANREHRYMLSAVPSRAQPNPDPLPPCSGGFTRQYEIPCRHTMLERHNNGGLVLQRKTSIHTSS
ncbi:hypothetical protein C8A03DRAFT_47126 [Achaetomium macrosporum]|uniref:Transposase n=1 Tax=Achaetomium macrosporum TaxID=79813 RepID=A0AAN7C3W5_9PEZI|nr:hypothetical protein C8A03DRAFT_47126 [Achaetomium macrosporum]